MEILQHGNVKIALCFNVNFVTIILNVNNVMLVFI